MSPLAKALSVAILMGTAGQAAAVDNGGPIDRALTAIKTNPVATRYSTAEIPLRFCYVASAYRAVRQHRGQAREILQAGIELVGAPGPAGIFLVT